MTPAAELARDPFRLSRFVEAQAGIYAQALAELQTGRKRSHWMWFIFPQLDGLGRSPTARRYAITGLEEARQYLAHPELGPRLLEVTQAVLGIEGRSAAEIFGSPDDLKLRSSMTLFAAISAEGSVFSQVLDKFYRGGPDRKTLDLLAKTCPGLLGNQVSPGR